MWHPWRTLRNDYPDWDVHVTDLPEGYDAATTYDDRAIWISKRLKQAERRWALTHELLHAARGDRGPCNPKIETSIDREAARLLITISDLERAVVWAATLYELAAELWVPPAAVLVRVATLHPAERARITQMLADRDG